MKRLLMALGALALSGAAAPAAADWPCWPRRGGGVQDVYTLKVAPFSREYRFERGLRIPLAQPVTERVPIAAFLVVVEERADPSVGPRGPLDLHGALARAYTAAAREPDKLKEFFYAEGRPLFERACARSIDGTMRSEGFRAKSVSFHAPSEEGGLRGAWRCAAFPPPKGVMSMHASMCAGRRAR